MIRASLAVCAAIFVLVASSCAPPGPPAPAAVNATCADGSLFLSHVQMLDPNFLPNGSGAPVGEPFNGSPAMSNDLANAFIHAPPGFQQRLCGLSGIYICPSSPSAKCNLPSSDANFAGAWGYRSRAPVDSGKTYIAISAKLWSGAGSAIALHDYETKLLQSFKGAGASSVYSATPDDSWMTVLAALAHEVGHVRFVQTVKANGSYNFTPLLNCPTGDFFADWNYQHASTTHPHMQPLNGWRAFADRANQAGQSIDHSAAPYLSQLDSGPPGSYPYLYDLYQSNQPWASLFGAQTPDEDFVETYVIAVLTGYANTASGPSFAGPLTSLPLAIPNITGPGITNKHADVPNDLVTKNKSALTKRMACLIY